MKPKRIILVRHGQSEFNADNTLCDKIPDYKVALTNLGHQQAETAGAEIKALIGDESIQCYVSPYLRTKQTLEGLNRGGLITPRVREEVRLREQEFGHLQDYEERQRINEERDHFGFFYYRMPNGESGADVYDRVTTFLDTMHRDFAKPDYPDNALIVSHGLTIRLFLMRWFHWTVEYYATLCNPRNCQWYVMNLVPETKKYTLSAPMELWENPRGGHVTSMALTTGITSNLMIDALHEKLNQ